MPEAVSMRRLLTCILTAAEGAKAVPLVALKPDLSKIFPFRGSACGQALTLPM
jgi:hypothetical protein